MYESGELAETLGLESSEGATATQTLASESQPAGFTQIENRLG
jgi:hypothetical protein